MFVHSISRAWDRSVSGTAIQQVCRWAIRFHRCRFWCMRSCAAMRTCLPNITPRFAVNITVTLRHPRSSFHYSPYHGTMHPFSGARLIGCLLRLDGLPHLLQRYLPPSCPRMHFRFSHRARDHCTSFRNYKHRWCFLCINFATAYFYMRSPVCPRFILSWLQTTAHIVSAIISRCRITKPLP